MGYYIETEVIKGKADWLKEKLNAIRLTGPPSYVNKEFVPVCVVDNESFEAAAIAFDKCEAAAFSVKSDKRPKEWLLVRVEDAVRLCPKVEGKINWTD